MNQQTDVNTEILNSQANNAKDALLSSDLIRQQGFDIQSFVLDASILLEHIHAQLDVMGDLGPSSAAAADAINCFATCAMRNVELITQANKNILAAVQGGAA